MDPAAAAASAQSPGWNRPFDDKHHVELAPGIDLYQGSWNVTLIKQEDGVVVLEAPFSPKFTEGVLVKARADNSGRPIKAVLTTSNSWPHAAGVRQAVAEKLPVYLLDLNQPLLERMIAAPHRLQPDLLQTAPQRADWHVVAGKTEIGTGANRIVLYPLRGAERPSANTAWPVSRSTACSTYASRHAGDRPGQAQPLRPGTDARSRPGGDARGAEGRYGLCHA